MKTEPSKFSRAREEEGVIDSDISSKANLLTRTPKFQDPPIDCTQIPRIRVLLGLKTHQENNVYQEPIK